MGDDGSPLEGAKSAVGGAGSEAKDQLQSTSSFLRSQTPDVRVRDLVARALKRLGGGSHRLKVRLALLFTAIAGLVLLAVLGTMVTSTATVTADAEPYLTAIAKALTNLWAWGVLFLIGALIYAKMMGRMMAREAASETRFSMRTILRLAAEARTTNGTAAVDGTTDHSRDQLFAKLLRGLDAAPGEEVGDVAGDERVVDTDTETLALDDPEFGGALDGDTDDTAAADGDAADSAGDYDAQDIDRGDLYEALGLDPLAARLTGYDEKEPSDLADTMLYDGAKDAFALTERLKDAGAPVPERPDPEVVRRQGLTRDADGNPVADQFDWHDLEDVSADDADDIDDVDDADVDETPAVTVDADADADAGDGAQRVSVRTRMKRAFQTYRMDLVTGFNASEFAYRFGIPASLTTLFIFVLNQTLWFQLWVYPLILAAAVGVGGTYYTGYKFRQHRKLEALRNDPAGRSWNSVRVLLKRVDTDEITVYYAWMAGKRYADYDKTRLANKLADRWYEFLQNDRCAPAIQEKFHRDLKGYDPALYYTEHSDQEDGLPAIYDDIIREINESTDPEGIVPKHQLAERVMQRDYGVGHDPDLIAECYEDLYPELLAETEVELEDTDGEMQSVTVVHRRDRRIEPELAKLRTQFSANVSADESATYELPDVEQPSVPWTSGTPSVSH